MILASALDALHCFFLLIIQVTEVQAPEHDLLFGRLAPELLEGVAQFFGDTQAEQQPVVSPQLLRCCFSCPVLPRLRLQGQLALASAGRCRGLRF